jgi:hypothetical protein
MNLNEQISKMKSMMGIDEDYPVNFNMDEFKKLTSFQKRLQYCKERLPLIKKGSSRAVYKIDDTKVLKLAMNKKGLDQNENEAVLSSYQDLKNITAHVFDKHPNNEWIEMELAKPITESDFERFIGFDFKTFKIAINNYSLKSDPQRYNTGNKHKSELPIDPEIEESMWLNDFIYDIFNYIGNYGNVHVPDIEKLDSYGVVKRDGEEAIVLIDYGLSNDGWNKHYIK